MYAGWRGNFSCYCFAIIHRYYSFRSLAQYWFRQLHTPHMFIMGFSVRVLTFKKNGLVCSCFWSKALFVSVPQQCTWTRSTSQLMHKPGRISPPSYQNSGLLWACPSPSRRLPTLRNSEKVNAKGARHIAAPAEDAKTLLMHYSTLEGFKNIKIKGQELEIVSSLPGQCDKIKLCTPNRGSATLSLIDF